jgi:hypothetical protein
MKKIILATLYSISALLLVTGLLLVSPYYYYNKILKNDYNSKWFSLNNVNEKTLTPTGKLELKEPNLGNDDLWRKFHIRDTNIPLPFKNPFFFVAPILKYNNKTKITNYGISVFGTSKLEISKVFFVNNRILPSVIRSQDLFKLPISTEILKGIPFEKIWKDVFLKDISKWDVPYSELLYNLYLLQLRSVILPDKFKTFGLIDDQTAIVELFSKDKDYKSELVLTKRRGLIYSYLIVTDLNNNESQVLRYKYLKEISFRPSSETLSPIIYKEFKALEFKDQIGQIGMMYLISAYSHNDDPVYLKEMIKYLERGEGNQTPLKRLYEYANERYGSTFDSKIIQGLELEQDLILKRNIELEKQQKIEELSQKEIITAPAQKSDQERFEEKIQQAKENQTIKENRMIID